MLLPLWLIMIRVRIEGTYNNHLVQMPDHFEAEQKLKHIIEGTEYLKHWQAWDIDCLSLLPCLTNLLGRKSFLSPL